MVACVVKQYIDSDIQPPGHPKKNLSYRISQSVKLSIIAVVCDIRVEVALLKLLTSGDRSRELQ
jgi:hypothetical protein